MSYEKAENKSGKSNNASSYEHPNPGVEEHLYYFILKCSPNLPLQNIIELGFKLHLEEYLWVCASKTSIPAKNGPRKNGRIH